MAEHDQLYHRASYYDIALERDVRSEVDFLLTLAHDAFGRDPDGVLEVACGPGYHARALAARGLRVAGLDYSAGMIDLARERAEADGVDVAWIVGDMRSFDVDERFDLAICMFDGVDAMLEDDDFVRHLQAVARHLRPGGRYVIDCTHPRICSYAHYGSYRYDGERDGVAVSIVWATNEPRINPVTGVADVSLELHVRNGAGEEIIEDRARERCFTAPELRLLARLSGVFDLVDAYGGPDPHLPLATTPDAERMILVLRKKD